MTAKLLDSCCEAGSAGLLSIHEAARRAAAFATPLTRAEEVDLFDAGGRTLAEPIHARVCHPRFDQSAMDGYAVASASAPPGGSRLPVSMRIPAGCAAGTLPQGSAARIFTGAPIPAGADAVVMQEHVVREADVIHVPDALRSGANIRRRGEDISAGELLLSPGERLDPRHVALLAAQGIGRVKVLAKPRVAVFSSGDELRQAGEELGEEAIFDSNRLMLLTLAREAGFVTIDGGCVADDPAALADRIRELSTRADLIVSSGGVSVGEEDHSAAGIALAGGDVSVLKIAMKPGKPAAVGRIGAAAYLGLPGNPVSALVSWLRLGGAMAAALTGRAPRAVGGTPMTTVSEFSRRPGRTEFVPARIVSGPEGPCVEVLGRGGSARFKPLVAADGLAEIDASHGSLAPGDSVLFHPFHGGFVV